MNILNNFCPIPFYWVIHVYTYTLNYVNIKEMCHPTPAAALLQGLNE